MNLPHTPAEIDLIMTTPMHDEYQPAIGDYVSIKEDYRRPGNKTDAKTWKVIKVPVGNGVNCTLEDPEGGRGLRAAPYMLRKASNDEAGTATVAVKVERFFPGELVKIAGHGWHKPADLVFVVLGESSKGGVKVTLLGGDRGRYYRHIPLALVTRVPAASVTVA